MNNDYIPYWKYLNLNENCSIEEVKNKFFSIPVKSLNKNIIQSYQLLSDSFYSVLYKKYKSFSFIENAGFFFEKFPEESHFNNILDIKFYSTPTFKLDISLLETKNDKPFIILLSTGCFAPLHNGHIKMMEMAKIKLEEEGYSILGGYLSPSHSDYLDLKIDNGLSSSKRIHLMEYILEDHWLMIDKWEALYNYSSVNFTTVLNKLEKYLQYYIDSNIKVCYVYGDDNIKFTNTFIESDSFAVCVERDNIDSITQDDFFNKYCFNNKNLFFVTGNKNKLSSTNVREGNSLEGLSKRFFQKYNILLEDKKFNKKIFFVKNDLINSFKNIDDKYFNLFIQKIYEIFDYKISIDTVHIQSQFEFIKKVIGNKKTISLDPNVKADYNVFTSRLFGLSSSQIKPHSRIFDSIIYNIPAGDYILIEDDIDTGSTIKWFYEHKDKNINIIDTIILNKIFCNTKYDDIIDFRDFIIGTNKGGAVCKIDNKIIRAPYILPFISPSTRAGIPFDKELIFSSKIWELNKNFYLNYFPNMKVIDLPEKDFQKLMLYNGFKLDDKVIDICEFYIKEFEKIL